MKNNLYNKIFHPCKLKAYRDEAKKLRGWLPHLLQDLSEAKTFEDLVTIHKFAWEKGFQNENLGPCEWGMFRTNSIPEMSFGEIYLGGIYGLNTHNIPWWNSHKEEPYSEHRTCFEVVFNQYRNHLRSNFQAIVKSLDC